MDKAKDFEKGFEEYKAKKKQEIEELGQDIYDNCPDLCENGCGGKPCYKCIAEALHRDNYRKIPENAVVLTREEYVESGDMYIDGKMEMQRYYDEVEIPKVKKETAEKFEKMALKEIKAISVKNEEYLLEDESVYEDSSLENVLEKVKIEICKEFTDKGVQNGG